MAGPSSNPSADPRLISLLRQAAALRQAGNLAETLKVLRQATLVAPRNAELQHDLGATCLALGDREAALGHFDRAIGLDSRMGLAHFRRGVSLELLGRAGFAEAYERAIETTPSLAEPYACLASAREQAGRPRDALRLYRQALARSAAGSTPALIYTARIALIEQDLDAAEHALRQVLSQDPAMSSARGLLAGVLNARGAFDLAAAELETALTQKPRDVSLYYNLVQTRRFTVQDAPLIARMRSALDCQVPAPARLRLHLALARALDDVGDYAAAMPQIEQAGKLRARDHRMDRAALAALTDRTIALFTQAFLGRADHRRGTSNVPILVLGLPRSGTTLTEQILSSHPNVAGAGEVAFWDAAGPRVLDTMRPGQPADLAAVAEDYLARLRAQAGDAAHVVDKNPFNFRWALLAHLALPNARIVHCRRRPADNALSIMMTALRPQPLFSMARDDLLFCHGEYRRLMAHVRAVLPPERYYELHYEALVTDPAAQTRALLDFCGLPFDDACLAPERNTRILRTASVWQARQPIYTRSVGRWRNYAPWLQDFALLEETEQ
jgi:tetratricopeptide (TPR) repeat protein